MSERLSEEELALLEYRANEIHVTHHTTATAMRKALAELRRLRLSDEEREAVLVLAFLLNKHHHEPYAYEDEEVELAIAALRRLTGGES